MTEFVEKRTGWFGRAMRVLRSWERALEYTPYDYAIDRVGALEQEVLALRAELEARVGAELSSPSPRQRKL